MKVRKIGKKLFYYVLLLAVVFNTSLSVPLFAKTRIPDEYKYAENNIIFYNSEGESSDNCTCYQSYGAIKSSDILLIGDEITRVSESEIKRLLPDITIRYIDNNNDNPYASALSILNNYATKEKIVITVGTNKEIERSDVEDIIKKVDSRILVLTTNLSTNNDDNNIYNNQNNRNIKDAAEYRTNVLVADWADKAKNTDYYFDPGNSTKPNNNGAELYAKTIFDVLSEDASRINPESNVLYNGEQILSPEELNKVTQKKSVYEDVARDYDIPWQVFAAINYRENNFSEIKKDHLKEIGNNIKANYMSGVNLKSSDGIKQLFHNYGGISESYSANARDLGFSENAGLIGEASPYVMNLADANRDSRNNSEWEAIINKSSDPNREKTLRGAFLVYAFLGGTSTENCYCGTNGGPYYIIGNGNMNINQTAINLALPWTTQESYSKTKTPTPAYEHALQVVNIGGDSCARAGNSCDVFVATVFRYSGVDPDFACCGVSRRSDGSDGKVWKYVTTSSKYIEIENKPENMRAGDILIKTNGGGHIELFVEINGIGHIAAASHCSHTGAIRPYDYNYSQQYRVFRWVGN